MKNYGYKIILLILFWHINVYGDNYQITSHSVTYDLKHYIAIYDGNVQLHHLSEQLTADHVIIYYDSVNHHPLKFVADGSKQYPAYYHNKTTTADVTSQALQIVYDLNKKIIILAGNASLKKNQDAISAPKIWYDIVHESIRTSPANKIQKTVIILEPQNQR